MNNHKVSLCMIVKNEEDCIERCLTSVQDIVDEMIIVDTGSTDKTIEKIKKFNAKILYYPWDGSFSNARNMSLEYASGYWILLMDADDELAADDKNKLTELIENGTAEGYFFETLSYVGEKQGSNIVDNLNIRLVRNNKQYRFTGKIHEQLGSNIQRINKDAILENKNIRIYHYGYLDPVIEKKDKRNRNINILKTQLEFDPENIFTLFNLGTEYYALGQRKKALKYYEHVYEKGDLLEGYGSKLLIRMATCYSELGETNKAEQVIARGLEIYPDFTDLLFILGSIYLNKSNYSLAIDIFKKCISMGDPPIHLKFLNGVGDFRSYFAIGDIYLILEDYNKSIFYLKKCINSNHEYVPAYIKLGFALLKTRSIEECTSELEKLTDLNKTEDLDILYETFYELQNGEKAMHYIDKIIKMNDPTTESLYKKARSSYMLHKYEDAYNIFSTIDKSYENYIDAAVYTVLCLWNLKRSKEAGTAISILYKNYKDNKKIKVLYALQQLLNNKETAFLLSDNKEESKSYVPIILLYIENFLQTMDFNNFEKSLKLFNMIDDNTVLYKLGELYYKYGYNKMANDTLVRSIKELNYYNKDMFYLMYKTAY